MKRFIKELIPYILIILVVVLVRTYLVTPVIVSGDSKKIQKFYVFYGSAGTGKSTIINIIQELFDGYYTMFNASALAKSDKDFALSPFSDNPLIAIEHDADLGGA